MPNRLATESSPYLLQHANNPVDWHPWGHEALELSRSLDRPIFLSIGYSACHWCHVMEHESFENDEIARQMNALFICIKVDREERPDLDQIYMSAVQTLTGRGGWPMSVFLTPQCEPFYGGTYWPPTPRLGMPSFPQILQGVAEAWKQRKEQALAQATALTEHVQEIAARELPQVPLSVNIITNAASALANVFDARHGGFGQAPKFPHPMDLRVLLRAHHRTGNQQSLHCVTHTLTKMAAGGIYDQLGGGFHRYSVDERWLVPHFEKMLYDNALLIPCYLEAFQITGNPDFARVVGETCEYLLREMTDERGGFYSTQDADSEGEEGKFFVWTPAEVAALLGDQASTFCKVYDITNRGNFEGANILNLPKSITEVAEELQYDETSLRAELAEGRRKLFAARERRVKPWLDDKVIVAWNGLTIDALALASGVLKEPRYLRAAKRAADFLLANCRDADGRLLHVWRHENAKLAAYLDDFAALANGLVTLYEVSADAAYLQAAVNLTEEMLARFGDNQGGFFYTAHDHEQLIARPKDLTDNATPGGNSLAATLLTRLGLILGKQSYLDLAEKTISAASVILTESPTAAGQMLLAYDLLAGPSEEWVFVNCTPSDVWPSLSAVIHTPFTPRKVIALLPARQNAPPCLAARYEGLPNSSEPTLLRCQGFACEQPIFEMENIRATILGEKNGR